MRVIVYAERVHKYEIEVDPDAVLGTTDGAPAIARRAIEEASKEGVLSFWGDEQPLDFDVEVLDEESQGE